MIRLGLRDNQSSFLPGHEVEGAVLWEYPEPPPERVELLLAWSTHGKGTADASVVETIPFEKPSAGDTRTFKLRLPEGPYSMDGRLISITWLLEAVAYPMKEHAEIEIVIGPERQAVVLPRMEAPPKNWKDRRP